MWVCVKVCDLLRESWADYMMMMRVCVSKCLSLFLYILFSVVGHGCFVNSCLRILACALGGEKPFFLFVWFFFVSCKLTNTWVGGGWHQHRICIYILYTDMTTFKSIGRKRKINSCIYCCKSSYSANWQNSQTYFKLSNKRKKNPMFKYCKWYW